MSGLYNMLMGKNPYATYLMGCAGHSVQSQQDYPIGRIRDVYTNDAGDRVFVLHRNYEGGEGWSDIPCSEILEKMKSHPNYVGLHPTTDNTYWVWEFRVLGEPQLEVCKVIAEMSDNTPAWDRYKKAVDDFTNGVDNEQTRHMKAQGDKLLKPMLDQLVAGEMPEGTVSSADGNVVIKAFNTSGLGEAQPVTVAAVDTETPQGAVPNVPVTPPEGEQRSVL